VQYSTVQSTYSTVQYSVRGQACADSSPLACTVVRGQGLCTVQNTAVCLRVRGVSLTVVLVKYLMLFCSLCSCPVGATSAARGGLDLRCVQHVAAACDYTWRPALIQLFKGLWCHPRRVEASRYSTLRQLQLHRRIVSRERDRAASACDQAGDGTILLAALLRVLTARLEPKVAVNVTAA